MTPHGKLTRSVGRYHVSCADGLTLSRYFDDLETAGRCYMERPGGPCDIYDTVAKRYIDPEHEIPCVEAEWLKWWWGERVWFARLAHKLGLNDPRPINWTVSVFSTRSVRRERRQRERRLNGKFRRTWWKRALDLVGIEVL